MTPTRRRPSRPCHERVAAAPETFRSGLRPWVHPADHGTLRTALCRPLLQIPCWLHPPLPAAPGAAVYPNKHAAPVSRASFRAAWVALKWRPEPAPKKNRSKYIPRPAPLPAKFPGSDPLTCRLSLLILPIRRSVFKLASCRDSLLSPSHFCTPQFEGIPGSPSRLSLPEARPAPTVTASLFVTIHLQEPSYLDVCCPLFSTGWRAVRVDLGVVALLLL